MLKNIYIKTNEKYKNHIIWIDSKNNQKFIFIKKSPVKI